MLEMISKNSKEISANGFTEITMKDSYIWARKLSSAWGLICLTGVVTMTLAPILMGKRDLPLKVWYPFDDKANYIYEILYTIEFIGQIQMSLSFINSSGMYLVFVIIICSQYDVLFCSIKNFVITAELSANPNGAELKNLQTAQNHSNDEAQQYLFSIERENLLNDIQCSQHNRIEFLHKKSFIHRDLNKNYDDKREYQIIHGLRDALKNCVEHHLFIINVAKNVENFFSPVCLVKILQITIQLCLLAFVMIKSTDQDNAVVRVVTILQYLSLTVMELLILTYYGELITTHSLRLSDAFQRSNWYLHSTKIKQEILIILQNSVRPVILTAGKIINLDVERFRLTITTAFSFMTLLQKLDARK